MPATATIVLVMITLAMAVVVVIVIAHLRILVCATLFISVMATIVLVVSTLAIAVVVGIARCMVMVNLRLISPILHHVVHGMEQGPSIDVVAETRLGRAIVLMAGRMLTSVVFWSVVTVIARSCPTMVVCWTG